MSTIDVGDAFELTFTTVTGADVDVTWLDPDLAEVLYEQSVAENPTGSGKFPYTFLPTRSGTWTAVFRASGMATAEERYYVRVRSNTGPLPLATVGDVAEQFGAMTTAQEGLASGLLRAASAMIRARYPSVDAWIADGRINGDLVALAATNMVLRVLRNQGGLRSETIGPFSRTYDTTYAAGLLVLGKDEQSLLIPPVSTNVGAPIGTARLRAGLAPRPYRGGWGGWGW